MTAETHEFKTEMKQLMDIIVHSLYSHKEIFLRELISNAADAIDKVRFESLTNADILEGDAEWKIKLVANEEEKTLTITDNGIGMSRETVAEDLGTIARSGTRAFMEQIQEAKDKELPELIGQFGVGFYSAFMVADRVTVVSRAAGQSGAIKWESDGSGTFTLEEVEKTSRGTDITLHMREEASDYLQQWQLRQLVTKFSDFIEHPVVMDVEKTSGDGEDEEKTTTIEEETLNSQQAIWLRPKDDVDEEQHKEFYHHVSHNYDDPLETVHYTAEGVIEFRALLYLPRQRPFDLSMPDSKTGLHLYVKRVFIMDDCKDLIPEYFRFVKGVVDASDLPLNVSREMLQHNPMLEKIKKNLVAKLIGTLKNMKEKRYDDYVTFYSAFGAVLKEGVHADFENKDKLADLLLFRSTKSDDDDTHVTLQDYVAAMPSDQEEIYYLVGENLNDMRESPYLEVFQARGQEVLLLSDPIDEWVTQSLQEYDGKKLKAADKGDIGGDKSDEKQKKKDEKTFKGLLGHLGEKIGEVKEVRLSSRLTDSAACLVADEHEMSAHMERLMKRMGQDAGVPPSQRILELNASHPVVVALQKRYDDNDSDPAIEGYGRLLYDQAVLAEGSKLSDPSSFATRVNALMLAELDGGDAPNEAAKPAGAKNKSTTGPRKKAATKKAATKKTATKKTES
jgi:molecular chaperone HtpG